MEICLAFLSDTVWFTPTLLVLLALTTLLWEVLRQRSRVPVGGPAPRPPGESLRINLDGLSEKLVVRLLFTVGFALLTGIAARGLASRANFPLVYAVLFTGSAVALGLTLWTWNLVNRWRTSHHGFEGERMVGRELNLLMLDGCRVFHDLVNERIGNLDHIIVAPHAIFVVETETYQKAARASAENDNRVIFNGSELRFPNRTSDAPVRKAARNAKWLEKHLARKTGFEVPVQPILTLPGWHVERMAQGSVLVLDPGEIASVVVDKAAPPLYEAQRQRIISLLDAECQFAPF